MTDANLEDIYPLSPMQQGMLFHTLYEPESALYIEQIGYTMQGPLKPAAFVRAWETVIARHAILRSAFLWEDVDEPVQLVYEQVGLPVEQLDWRDAPREEREPRLAQLLEQDRRRGFDLESPPLIRLTLIAWAAEESILIWTHHHLLLDGWSLPLLLSELFELYEAYAAGRRLELPPTRPYRDYIGWLQAQDQAVAEAFWREYLAGLAGPTRLPVERPAQLAAGIADEYREEKLLLPADLLAQLQAFAQQNRITLNSVLQGAWAILLSRYSGEHDVVFGATVSGRPTDLPGAETMIGLFINTLPVRLRFDPQARLTDWLREVHQNLAQLRQYEYSSLAQVQAWSEIAPGTALFENIFIFENYPVDASLRERQSELTMREIASFSRTNYPLTMSVLPGPETLLELGYDCRAYAPETARRMIGHLRMLLEHMVAGSEALVGTISLLSPDERTELLAMGHGLALPWPSLEGLHRLISRQAGDQPAATAVIYNDEHLSYAALEAAANHLANRLQAAGLQPGGLVAIALERGVTLPMAVLAVWKAGGAFLPLDLDMPGARLATILTDAAPDFLLTAAGVTRFASKGEDAVPLPQSTRLVLLDAAGKTTPTTAPSVRVSPDQPAYLIYTSGSTGTPRGVLVEHRQLLNAYVAWEEAYKLEPGMRHLQMASFGFDVFVGDMARALGSGGTLVLCPRAVLLDPPALAALIACAQIDCAEFVPVVLRSLMTHLEHSGTVLDSLRLVICGSDSWYSNEYIAFRRLLGPAVRLINSFGLTEATIDSTYFEPDTQLELADDQVLPIGRPYANMRAYILDLTGEPAPIGVPGELYIGGAGVARGYLHRPELNAARFLPDPFNSTPGACMYRSGDRACWLADGNIAFLGRADNQVKIRGFRIEPGEVEIVLGQHPASGQVAVVPQPTPTGETWLVAYLTSTDPRPTPSELRQFVQERLPDYMVPALFVLLEEMPLLPSGKIDRRALPTPDWSLRQVDTEFVPPRTPAEELIAGIWQDLLGLDVIGIHANFFALGGHSLLATRLVSRLRDAFQAELDLPAVFAAPTVAGIAAAIAEFQAGSHSTRLLPPIVPVPRDADLPLSFAQQRLWFLDQLEPDSPLYNNPGAVRLRGDLDRKALHHSLNQILARHEALRTGFSARNGRPVQVIAAEIAVDLPLHDLRALPTTEREAQARRLAEAEVRRPFDLSSPPLMRAALLQIADDDFLLLFTIHHIVSDGWSMGVFIAELVELYSAAMNGSSLDLPPLPVQYADFAHWQREWLAGNGEDSPLTVQLDYWRTTLQHSPPVLMLPTDRPRPSVQSFVGASYEFEFTGDLLAACRAFSAREGVTLFMTLLATFKALLFRYSGQEDILIGTPIANRTRTELEGLIGFFVNTLVIRSRLAPDLDFYDLLAQVRTATMGAYDHQDLPFEMLVEALQPQRDLSHSPLFQVMFVLDNTPQQFIDLPGLQLSPFEAESGTARFDLTWQLNETPDGLHIAIEYATDLFDEATIARMAGHYRNLLWAALRAPDQPLGELSLLDPAERDLLLVEWNRTAAPFPANDCVHWLFEGYADTQPAAPALIFGDTILSYGELDQRANRLAQHLARRGIEHGALVGICTERSIEMIVGILAVLKAGAAYVPLDPSYPADRLAFMLGDAGIDLLLTQAHLREQLPLAAAGDGPPLIALDADWPAINKEPASRLAQRSGPDDLAYVIYTSGSTGRPKGTLLAHRGLCNLVFAQRQAFGVGPGSRVLQFSPFSFDASVWELVMALGNGGALVLAEQEQLVASPQLLRLLREAAISTVTLPPSLLALLDPAELPALTTVIAAGERCSREIVQRWAPGRQFFNAYGPTETTVCATMARCSADDPADPPIGRPLPNFQIFVLDAAGEPAPIGVPGELHIGGVALAQGYLGRPELTAERFIPNPFLAELPPEIAAGPRLYRSGDLVRYRADGNLEFLGRIDHQVKLRGFRIELGEIEATLRRHPALQDALVLAREDIPGNPQLVAYLIAAPDSVNPAELRAFLRETLPEYMLPAAFVRLDEWPLTPSRKIDRAALPPPDAAARDAAPTYVAPRDETEAALAAICGELLGLERVGVADDFFALGGHSLLATRFLARIHEHFQVELPLRSLFEQPTVAGIAALLKNPPATPAAEVPAIVARSRTERRVRRADLEIEQK